MANDLTVDRVTVVSNLSACQPGVYILARNGAGAQFDYGTASNGSTRFAVVGCP